MAVLAPFLVLCTFVLGFHQVEATADTLFSQESSSSHGQLRVGYPGLVIDNCVTVPQNLRNIFRADPHPPEILFLEADKEKKYVLVMVDPDAPSPVKPKSAYWRHWLVVDLEGTDLMRGQIGGTTLTEYSPPSPPSGSGFHRYQFMLYEQPPNSLVSLSQKEASSRGKWDLPAYISRAGLGEPVATQMFITQNSND